MTGPPRDWDKEMAEIDRLMARQPAAGSPGAREPGSQGAGGSAVPAPRPAAPVSSRRESLTTWFKVFLGAGTAAAVAFFWPYPHACGLQLYGYLAAAAGAVLVALWSVVASWKSRMAAAHGIALLSVLLGAALIGKAVLDRTGYSGTPSTWSCP
jgi:hypothetical protein